MLRIRLTRQAIGSCRQLDPPGATFARPDPRAMPVAGANDVCRLTRIHPARHVAIRGPIAAICLMALSVIAASPAGSATERQTMTVSDLVAIAGDTARLPVNTAIDELRSFIADRRDGHQLPITAPADGEVVSPGTIVLGTPGHPAIARWLREGDLAIPGAAAAGAASVDAYEIAVVDGCIAVAGATPRAMA